MLKIRSATATLYMCATLFAQAAPSGFQEATVTEAVNRVDLLSGASQRPAKPQDRIRGNDVVRTGQRSRAELKFPDSTIARVGSNAAFSFRPDTRGFDLQKGSILFHSPKGLGGGQIRTAAATASVLGTTIIVSATQNGGFKVLVLEGKAKVDTPNGRSLVLKAGEMTFILIKNGSVSPALTFRLNQQVQDANLVNGFAATLPSLTKIGEAIKRQEQLIGRGILNPTQFLIGHLRGDDNLELLDPNSTPQNTDPFRRFDNPATRELFLALLDRYHFMLNRPGLVDDRPLDERHLIHPAELDNPLALEAFLLALTDAGLRSRPSSAEGAGVDILNTPDFSFAPLQAGFVARGIAFNDATINLSRFRPADIFTFLSLADIFINGNLEVGGFRGIVDFHARGVIHFPAEASIASLNPGISMVFASGGPMNLDTMSFDLPGGFLGLASGRDIDIHGVSATADKGIRIAARGYVDISDFSLYTTYGGGYGLGGYTIVNGPPEYEIPIPDPKVDIFAGGPITLNNVDFGPADVVALTPGTLTIGGSYFTANGIDALAGTMDIDFSLLGDGYYPSLDFIHLTQFADWSLGPMSLGANGDIALGSFGTLSLDQVYLDAYDGIVLSGKDVYVDDYSSFYSDGTLGAEGIVIDSSGKLYVEGMSSLSAGNKINLMGMDVRVEDSYLTVNSPDPLHAIRIDARNSLHLVNASLNSSGPILLDAKTILDVTGGSMTALAAGDPENPSLRLTAGDRLNISGTSLNAQNIRLQAITIALRDVNFPTGSQVTLRSGNGMLAPHPNDLANNGGVALPGYVNYIDNVRYGGTLLLGDHSNISIQKINP